MSSSSSSSSFSGSSSTIEFMLQQETIFLDSLNDSEKKNYDCFVSEQKVHRFLKTCCDKFMTKKYGKTWRDMAKTREIQRINDLHYFYNIFY